VLEMIERATNDFRNGCMESGATGYGLDKSASDRLR
jgi:hypothetical protein